jgi:8-amino-7-oxononanoate synthase
VTAGPLQHLADELAALAKANRLRERQGPLDAGFLNLCSNDYLGYQHTGRLSAALAQALADGTPLGSGASRLVSGERGEHRDFEASLASWLGTDASLAFSSGYAANVGTVAALAVAGDHVISDALNHASIVDGCRLGRARVTVFEHMNLDAVRRALAEPVSGKRWVVTESYFSMDGDSPDLPALRRLCDAAGAGLMVDEAHALGVFGPRGRGLCAAFDVRPDVLVGSLGKAAAGQGAFVAGSRVLCDWLWNRARSFVYSTGLSPLLAAMGSAAVRLLAADEQARATLAARVASLREGLGALSLEPGGAGPIIPIVLGGEARALAWSRGLAARGILVQAIRPPTVPIGAARLRVTARADLTMDEVSRVLAAFAEIAKEDPRA